MTFETRHEDDAVVEVAEHPVPVSKPLPVLVIMHGEASFSAPTAHCSKHLLEQAGATFDFVPLASLGIHGNGHFVMHEKNNLQVAGAIADWLRKRVTPTEGKEKRAGR